MEVMTEEKRGFKRTEVGLIPEDWDLKSLNEIGAFSKGKGIRKSEVKNVGIPCIRYGELYTRHHDQINEFYSFIDENVAKQSRKLYKGDILFAGSGETKKEIGKCVAFNLDVEAYSGGDIVILSPSGVDSKFLGYALNSEIANEQKYQRAQGDAVVHIYSSSLSNLKIPLPPTLTEQQAIAEALSDVDELIRSLDGLIQKKQAIKKGTMQQLLTGKKRLPGFDGKWEVKKLGDLLLESPDYGINAPAIDYNSNYPTYLRITDISEDGRFIKADKKSVKAVNSYMYYLNRGEIVLARTGASTGKSYHYDPKDGELVFAGFLIRIKPNPLKLLSHFLKYFLQTDKYWNWVKTNSMRSGQPGLNSIQYSSLEILTPPLKEQKAIAQILSDMDRELQALHQKREKYVQIKQGMMQELLTGKTRLI